MRQELKYKGCAIAETNSHTNKPGDEMNPLALRRNQTWRATTKFIFRPLI
mgnify:CR=1 FL=1